MIDLRDARTPSLREISTSALMDQYIEDVLAKARLRGAVSYDDEREERLTAIGAELNRRIPTERT
jgi:hypothetical protein